MRSSLLTTYLLAIFAMSCWALSFVWIKIVYRYYEPLTTITLRLLIASLLLVLTAVVTHIPLRIPRTDIKSFLLLAFAEPFCYFLGESFGMKYVSSTIGAIIISTIPLFVILPGVLFFRERISTVNLIGIALSFCGVLAMVWTPGYHFGESPEAPLHGVALLFFAVLSAVGYSTLIKQIADRYHPVTIVTWQSILGLLYFTPLFFLFDFDRFRSVNPTIELIGTLSALSVFASVLAFLCYIPVIRTIGITKANVFANLIPVMTAFFSFLILGEQFSSQKVTGIALVIGGLYLSNTKNETPNLRCDTVSDNRLPSPHPQTLSSFPRNSHEDDR